MITTIIPALIDSAESQTLLTQTIARIHKHCDSSLIIITQGRKPNSLVFEKGHNISWIHTDNPLTKWEAIRRCQNSIPERDKLVALLDADDPIEGASLTACYEYASKMPEECVLGRRKEICLPATDAFSSETRFFLEILSNTLLLKLLKKNTAWKNNPPDIQNCLYIVNANTFSMIDLSYIGSYGGELALFYELSLKNVKINNIDIVPIKRKSSHYNIDSIIKGILNLPFFLNIKKDDLNSAKKIAPIIYGRYMQDGALRYKYWEEIDKIIDYFDKYL